MLVHGAFADGSSWQAVVPLLQQDGHKVIVVQNANSYGGAVITGAAVGNPNVKALVYVAAFAPAPGESCFTLAGMFPGSTLGDAVRPVPRSDGTTDFYIASASFHEIFCADVPASEASRLAVTQRPATQEALVEPSGDAPLWKRVPTCFLIGEEGRIIPAAVQRHMAERARAQRTIAVKGASHGMALSQPGAVAELVLEAARMPAAA